MKKLRSNTGRHVPPTDADDIIGTKHGTVTFIVSGPIDNQLVVVHIPAKDRDGNKVSEPDSTALDSVETKLKDAGYKEIEISYG